MLRVVLLSRAVASKVKNLGFSENDLKLVTVAALFHDIAYPLAEIDKVFVEITKAMNKCYKSIKYPDTLGSFEMTAVTQLIGNMKLLPNMNISDLGNHFNEHNHGLLGAMEFLQCMEKETIHKYRSAINAIIYHDPAFKVPISVNENKPLSLLVICDEMQEWGRAASFEKEPTISEIKGFDLNNKRIAGEFVWDNASLVSPLRQIYAKKKNLQRLDFSQMEKEIEIELRFALPEYQCLNYHHVEGLIQKLYANWKVPDSIFRDFAKELNLEIYEKLYFGMTGGYEDKIVEDLSRGKFVENSPITQDLIFFSPIRNEALYVDVPVESIEKIIISINNRSCRTTMKAYNQSIDGDICSQSEKQIEDLAKRIVSELLVLNLIISYEYFEKGDKKTEVASIVPVNFINEFLRKKHMVKEEIDLITKVVSMRECLKEQGFFLFHKS